MALSDAEINILIKARDEASKTLNAINLNAQKLGKVGFAVLGAGLGLAAAGMAKFVQEAAAEQANIARLTTAIGHLSAADRDQARGVELVIAQREQLAFADDALRDSLSLLVTQTGSYSDSLNRQKIAMDVSRGTGIDLATSSRLLGKINEETTNTFARYGIVIQKGATETEALAAIQSRFSGQAAAYANTAAGQWDIVRIKFADIREDIGMLLLPTVQRLTAALADFLTRHQADIEDMARSVKDGLAVGFAAVERALGPVIDLFNRLPTRDKVTILAALAGVIGGALVAAMLSFAAAQAIAFATNPLTVWIVVIGLAVVAVTLLVRHWDQAWGAMKAAPAALLDWFTGGGWRDVLLGASGPIGWVLLLARHWDSVFAAMPAPVQSAMNAVAMIIEKAVNFIIESLNAVTEKINAIGNVGDVLGVTIPDIPQIGGVSFQRAIGGASGELIGHFADGQFERGVQAASAAVVALTADLGGGQFGGGGGSVASAADTAAQELRQLAVLFQQWGEATGGTLPQFVARIEMMRDESELNTKLAEAELRANVEREKAADATYGLRTALKTMALEALQSGKTITAVARDAFAALVDNLRSSFNGLFSRPTREGAQLNLEMALLEEEQARLRAAGASEEELKALEEQIDAVRKDAGVLDAHAGVLKAQIDAADKSLITEAQRDFSALLYIAAMNTQSGTLAALTDQAALESLARTHLIDAMQNQAHALGAATSATDPFTTAEKHWINAVAAGKGEPDPFPGFATGGRVTRTGLALVHEGELITPSSHAGNTYHVYIQEWHQTGTPEAGFAAASGVFA